MNNYYSAGIYKHDPRTFGGLIYNYDFDGYVSIQDIAKRILSDQKFDQKWRKNMNQKFNYSKKGINKWKKLHTQKLQILL